MTTKFDKIYQFHQITQGIVVIEKVSLYLWLHTSILKE